MFAKQSSQFHATQEKAEALQGVVQECERMLAAIAINGITMPDPDVGSQSIDANDL